MQFFEGIIEDNIHEGIEANKSSANLTISIKLKRNHLVQVVCEFGKIFLRHCMCVMNKKGKCAKRNAKIEKKEKQRKMNKKKRFQIIAVMFKLSVKEKE